MDGGSRGINYEYTCLVEEDCNYNDHWLSVSLAKEVNAHYIELKYDYMVKEDCAQTVYATKYVSYRRTAEEGWS